MAKKIEAFWDCAYCGQKGIGGLTKQCPNCGHPQDKDIKFYLPDDVNEHVLDEDTAKEYGQGADWMCSFCNSLNRYNETICHNCGADRNDQIGDYFSNKDESDNYHDDSDAEKNAIKTFYALISDFPDLNSFTDEEIEVFSRKYRFLLSTNEEKSKRAIHQKLKQELSLKRQRQARGDNSPARYQNHKSTKTSVKKKRKTGCLAILAIFFAIILFAFWPRTSDATVTQKAWSRSISVEEYKTVQESDWSVPEGGRVYKSKREIHHYDQVLDHYENVQVQRSREVLDGYDVTYDYVNNGDGTYDQVERSTPRYRTETYYETERQPVFKDVPVFKKKYYYEIERWVPTRSVDSKGESDEPYWNEVTLGSNEREGEHTETYSLTFKTKKDKTYVLSLSQDAWNRINEGDTVKITVQNGKITKLNGTDINEL